MDFIYFYSLLCLLHILIFYFLYILFFSPFTHAVFAVILLLCFFCAILKNIPLTQYYFFRSSEDLVHRLFVCIAGVADQLQTNFASDLRNILKCVFLMNSSQMIEDAEGSKDQSSTSINQSTNAPLDTIETGSIHERQESLAEYEDMDETALTHDRSMNIFFLFFCI